MQHKSKTFNNESANIIPRKRTGEVQITPDEKLKPQAKRRLLSLYVEMIFHVLNAASSPRCGSSENQVNAYEERG